jgi:hypothetical protein
VVPVCSSVLGSLTSDAFSVMNQSYFHHRSKSY